MPATRPDDDRIRAAQVAAVYNGVFIGVVSAASASAGLAYGMVRQGAIEASTGTAWSACVVASAIVHVVLAAARRRADRADGAWRQWGRAFVLVALIEGGLWGWASVSVGGHALDLQYLVVAVTYAIAAGAISAFGSYMPGFLAFFLPATIPFMVRAFDDATMARQGTGVLTVIFVLGMPAVAWRANRAFRLLLRLQFERESLIAALAHEKAAAEQANVAKSQFLAAASHDLRQPVHALTLFLGALRQRKLDDAAQRLVGQIDETVAALDGLFSALLDISRLDSGTVRVQPQVVAIDPLLERVCRQWRPEAGAKGLELRLRPSRLHVLADPVLLERVVQNLVGNAVRHTTAGRVLVAARAAARVRIEVWDSGPGIPPELHERVFDEYFQLGNPGRDRARGLGLGLAIVRRVTNLMGAELTLCSRAGVGSCFAVGLPRVRDEDAQPAASDPGTEWSPGRGLVLVVDDEVLVRQATQALLASWGYDVVVAGSLREMQDEVGRVAVLPCLIICDYRLAGGENGIETVRALQAEFNEDIPALLISGDTAPYRLQEAEASGMRLLHKPLTDVALRLAMDGVS